MKLHQYQLHLEHARLSRRAALKAGAVGVASIFGVQATEATAAPRVGGRPSASAQMLADATDDEMFDVDAVEAGAWAPGPYGPGDQRGTFNEVTPEKTAAALRLLDAGRPVVTYNLGEPLIPGFPAVATDPPRRYEQTLAVGGLPAPPDAIQLVDEPLGPNRLTFLEERLSTTYQIGTQLDNLNHIGCGDLFYNGFRYSIMATAQGTDTLGAEQMGPLVTRGIVLDIVGLKVSQGATRDLFTASNGRRVLRDDYRITLDDIELAMARADVAEITPGDVVLFRTGWTHLARTDPERYLAGQPGIYLREARYLAQFRPAIIGADTWGLETLDPAVTKGNVFPVHQLLLIRHGIRIGEGIVSEGLVADGIAEFIYLFLPQNAHGATAANTPPAALAQPRR